MSEQFFIRLLPEADRAQWCAGRANVLPAHNDRLGGGSLEQALDAALQDGKGRQLVVIVPAADIVLSSVTLPIRQQSKLLQAVPYALEEQLAEDVELLHFAIGERQADGSVPVASVAHSTMEQWLAPFRERGLEPVAVLPEMLCLPPAGADSGWQVLIEGQACVIRSGAYAGFCCDVSELGDFLSMALSGSELAKGLRVRIHQVGGSELPSTEGLAISTEVTTVRSGLACLMPASLNANINLLQGDFASEPELQRLWRPLKASAFLLLAWVLTSTAYYSLQHAQLGSQLETLETENMARFQQLFPQVPRIVDMRAQGEQQLALLRQDGGGAGLFPLIGATANAVKNVQGLQVQEIQLRDGYLFISMTASDIQALENLRGHFGKQPEWTFDVQSANAGTDGVQIRASLKRG